MDFGEFLERHGIKQAEVVKGTGLSAAAVSELVGNVTDPRLSTVLKVYDWCECWSRERRIPMDQRVDLPAIFASRRAA